MSGNFVGEGFESPTVVYFKVAEYFLFQFAVQTYEDKDKQNFCFACYFEWVWNLVSHTDGGT